MQQMRIARTIAAASLIACLAGCGPAVETHSLLGEPLRRPALTDEQQTTLEQELADARRRYAEDPDLEENVIWYGRRLAYLSRYNDAVRIYSKGLRAHPDSYRLLRHRGHRFITLRRFDDAIADLSRAAALIARVPDEVEPDGRPNPMNIPRSTSHSNIWYHLGLAHYLKGDFDEALAAYRSCMKFSANDDMLCATSHWLYMTLRRLGRPDEARAVLDPIRDDMEIFENHGYHRLLLMYKAGEPPNVLLDSPAPHPIKVIGIDLSGDAGDDPIDVATVWYGVANWHLYHDDPELGLAICEAIVEKSAWAAFGHIAAEAELARRRAD